MTKGLPAFARSGSLAAWLALGGCAHGETQTAADPLASWSDWKRIFTFE